MLAGETEAFAILVERYGESARRLAVREAGPDDGPDLAQEAFVRAFRYLHRYDPRRPFRPWLLRIVHNCCRTYASRHSWPLEPIPEPGDPNEPVDPSPGPEEAALRADRHRALLRALASLDHRERLLLSLRHEQELSYAEMATVLGWPVSLVRNRLARARARLARALEAEGVAGATAPRRGRSGRDVRGEEELSCE